MADKSHYNTTMKVPESVIEEIRGLGMAAAIKKAKSGKASPEFVEGVRRFYPKAIGEIDSKTAKRETAGAGIKTEKSSSSSNSVRPSQESVQRRLGSTRMSADAVAANSKPAPNPMSFPPAENDIYDQPLQFDWGSGSFNRPLTRPIDLGEVLGRMLQPVDMDEERMREIASRMRR